MMEEERNKQEDETDKQEDEIDKQEDEIDEKCSEDQVDCLTPEINYLLDTDNEYNFFHEKRGKALIINNINFRTGSNTYRTGGKHDTSRLFKIFNDLDFDVQISPDLTAREMLEKVREAASRVHYDHTNADCFACAILSHGSDEYDQHGVPHDVVYGVDGVPVYTRDIVHLTSDKVCPHLSNKPRIFIFQACRGDDLDEGQQVTEYRPVKGQDYRRDTVRGVDDSTNPFTSRQKTYRDKSDDIVVSPTPLFKDFLILYATPPGYSAWRGHEGSYFIQYLAEVFHQVHQEHIPLLKTLTRTSNRMAVLFKSRTKDSSTGKKQMPCIMSMLTKDICFRKKAVLV